MADKNGEVVGFVCQRCCQPVRLDPSFDADFTDYGLDEGDNSSNKTIDKEHANRYEEDEVDRLVVRRSQEEKANFEAAEAQAKSYNDKIKSRAKLFDILSSQSEIDHPLCDECGGLLLDFLDQELDAAEVDCRTYSAFLDSSDKDGEEDIESLQAELQKLKAEEENLQKQLKEGEKERESLLEERETQKQEALRLDQEEENFMLEYHSLEKRRIEFENEDRSVDYQMIYAQLQIERLKRTNIFNCAFHIWHRGHFGTINNFRLGRLPTVPVEWNEINAAWGQTALLLHCLAKKIGFTFLRYRLVPYGSYSFIEPLSDKSRQLTLL
ncbi:Beclin-1, partial [Trichoplax sp. H2]